MPAGGGSVDRAPDSQRTNASSKLERTQTFFYHTFFLSATRNAGCACDATGTKPAYISTYLTTSEYEFINLSVLLTQHSQCVIVYVYKIYYKIRNSFTSRGKYIVL